MTAPARYANPLLREQLAAQHALGLVRGRARRRLERLMSQDEALRTEVSAWQGRLSPLAESTQALTPPDRVWRAIERRVRSRREATRAASWWDNLVLWRAAAAVAVMLMLAVGVHVLVQPPTETAIVAVLTDADAQPVLVASAEPARRRLSLRFVGEVAVPEDKALELWYLPVDGSAPRSAGLIADARTTSRRLTEDEWRHLAESGALAVSLEPASGSPTGLPTGPVLFSGAKLSSI